MSDDIMYVNTASIPSFSCTNSNCTRVVTITSGIRWQRNGEIFLFCTPCLNARSMAELNKFCDDHPERAVNTELR